MSLIETRHHQMFPVFDRAQIETAKRFASGPARNFAPGEVVFEAGERNAPAWLVLKGSIDVVRRDGLDRESPITSHGPGQFSGEVSQLAGAGILASGRAGPQGCTALPFDAAHVRALMVGSADVGEILMRAFILRRVGLIEEGGVGSVLIGKSGTPGLVGLEGFLGLNGYPYTVLDASDDADGRAVVERFGVLPDELPLMVCPHGTVLKRPTDAEAGVILGITPELDPEMIFDGRWSARGRRGLPPPSMERPRAFRSSCSTSVHLADRRALRRGSRTISAFRPASRAWHLPAAPSTRRSSSVLRSRFRSRWQDSTAGLVGILAPRYNWSSPMAMRCAPGRWW